MNNCQSCGTETTNKKFCSRSCANSYNNRVSPKRKAKVRTCKELECDVIMTKRKVVCDEHSPKYVNYDNRTLTELKRNRTAHRFSTIVRYHSRKVYRESNKPKHCINCGYSKTYQVSHIKGIASFDLQSTLNEVNSIDNLTALCPNCHWEYDNGLISLPG